MKVTRLRVLVALVAVWAVSASFHAPVARADTVPGYPTPAGCVQGWTAFSMPVSNTWAEVSIRFHLVVSGTTGATSVRGRWETSAHNYTGSVWRSVSGASSSWFVTDATNPEVKIFVPPAADAAWLRYGLAVVDGPGCFWVDQVAVTRWANTGSNAGSSPTPGPTGAPPSASPEPSASPTSTSGSTWCSVYNGSHWEWVPCTAATPSPTPSASPSPSPGPSCGDALPVMGPGVHSVDFTTGSNGYCWMSYVPGRSATVDVSWSLTISGNPDPVCEGSGGNEACDKFRISDTTGLDSGVWASTGSTGTSSSGSVNYPGSNGEDKRLYFCSYHSVWPYGDPGGVSPTPCGSGAQMTGPTAGFHVTGTITITGGAPTPSPSPTPGVTPTPTPSPDPSFVAFCEENPGSWLCASAPPGWATPPPSPPRGNEPWAPVDICPPGQEPIAACATWPPMTFEPAPSFGDGAVSALASAYGGLTDALGDHAPFSWAGEVAGALDPSGYAGADIDWCFDAMGSHICVDPYDVTDPIAGFRGMFLGLLLVLVAWAVARRVWATVGGTPGTPDA